MQLKITKKSQEKYIWIIKLMKNSMNQENNNLIYFDRINKESYQYSDYKKFNSIREENIAATNYIDVSGGYNGYGGGYMNYVTQEQFNEYKEHVSTRFDNVDKVLVKIESDTSSTKENLKWLI